MSYSWIYDIEPRKAKKCMFDMPMEGEYVYMPWTWEDNGSVAHFATATTDTTWTTANDDIDDLGW